MPAAHGCSKPRRPPSASNSPAYSTPCTATSSGWRRRGRRWRTSSSEAPRAPSHHSARRPSRVESALAAELHLAVAATPWHTQRDRLCEVATTAALLVATLGKLARDLSLLAQTEVGEAFEPSAPGRGGSSTLPQKRNPVAAAIALAAATRVPPLVATMLAAAVQEHERGLGNWPAEWETLPQILLLTAGALDALANAVDGLEVDRARMRHNLDATHGQLMAEAIQMALAPAMGKGAAHEHVAAACREAAIQQRELRAVLGADAKVRAVLDDTALDRLFDPAGYVGMSDQFIDRVLAHSASKGS